MKRCFQPWVIELIETARTVIVGAIGGIAAYIMLAGWL